MIAGNKRARIIEGYLFIAPWMVGFLIFTLGPLISSIIISFQEWDGISQAKLVGFGNYSSLFADPLFYRSLIVTSWYTLLRIPLTIAGSVVLAVLLNQKMRGIRWWRTLYYFPSVTSSIAVAILFMWIFNSSYGLFNYLLNKCGIASIDWLGDPRYAIYVYVVMSLWGIGGNIPIYLAGLNAIPNELYEAAEADGAGPWIKFIRITVPMLTPTIFFNLIMNIIGSFQVFNQAYIISPEGGPSNSTLFYVLYLYNNAFRYYKFGYGSAMAWVLFAIVLVLTLIQFRLAKRWVYYETPGVR